MTISHNCLSLSLSLLFSPIHFISPIFIIIIIFRELWSCDVIVSTAIHEFYGVAVLEAVSAGCVPLCPNRLSYQELFPKEYLYNTDTQLFNKLKSYVINPGSVRQKKASMMEFTIPYQLDTLRPQYIKEILE